MLYGSVCSGIEAASVAWHPLGWEAAWLSEIEPFPSAVLAHHYPTVPNRGDMTRFQEWPDDPIDLLVGGTPCQSFSVAGLRAGLADPRGNLLLTYLAIAARYRPRWLVWENVPGVLSSGDGRDFGSLLGADMVGMPCPKCGANLLTDGDWNAWKTLFQPALQALHAAGIAEPASLNTPQEQIIRVNYHDGELRVRGIKDAKDETGERAA